MMPAQIHRPLGARLLLLLFIGILALGALPPRAASAALSQSELDNTIVQFSRGYFQRTALGSLQKVVPQPKLPDKAGAVQLGPIGLLKQWTDSPFDLKKSLTLMGATAVGNRVYVIGGSTWNATSQTYQSVAEVWSAAVNQVTGAFIEDWQPEPALIKVQGSNQSAYGLSPAVAEINSPAVTSVPVTGGGGFIYVIGGNTSQPSSTVDFSSFGVRIGIVGVDGRITGWMIGPSLPTSQPGSPNLQLGAQAASAQSITINGTTYVYVIGGMRKYRAGTGASIRSISEAMKAVFYAKVGADGQLLKPSTGTFGWDTLADLPVQGAPGLYSATSVADHYEVTLGGASQDVLFVVGGQTSPGDPQGSPPTSPTYSSLAYRALINANGSLAWDTTWQGTLPQTRHGLGGATYRGSLYMVGGIPDGGSEPDQGVLTSYVEDTMKLHQFNEQLPPDIQGGGTNFLKSNALRFPRAFHGTAIVPTSGTVVGSAFIYVFGGRGDTTDLNKEDDNGSTSVFYGLIGGSEDTASTGYAADAWYFSKPYDINYTGAQVQEVSWATLIDRSTADPDIEMWYRISSAGNCSNPGWSEADWKRLDGSADSHYSGDGQNSTGVGNLAARCLQYRAHLLTNNYKVTPALLNVSITIVVPGNPDLNLKSFSGRYNTNTQAFLGLNVVIQNVNIANPNQTLPANFEQGGSFFVDLCIYGPNPSSWPAPTLPMSDANHQCSKVFADLNKNLFPAKAAYLIPDAAWKDTLTEQPVDIKKYFKDPGTYKVIVATDSYDLIGEGASGEGNNVSVAQTVTVTSLGWQVLIPIARH